MAEEGEHAVMDEQVKSMALKKKGRGFSRAHFGNEEHHQQSSAFSRIRHFDSVTGESFGGAQRSVEGWVLFVTGLHEEATEEDVADKFADHGKVTSVKVSLDHRTGYVKGYALVEYDTFEAAAAAAAQLDGQPFMEAPIRVAFAFTRAAHR